MQPNKQVTPPSSFTQAPLTPPLTSSKPTELVREILRRVRLSRDIELDSIWIPFLKVSIGDYREFLHLRNESQGTENKLRHDYNSSTQILVIRMPTTKHDVFVARVVDEIQKGLNRLLEVDNPSRTFVQNVNHNGSGRLDLGGEDYGEQKIIRRQPDATFKHSMARWPGVVLEVSYSQKTKDIPYLADDYIIETDGSVRAVVGLDIGYKTKKCTISMWRPQYIKDEEGQVLEATQTMIDEVFRDESGNPNPSRQAGLRLDLKDFAPKELAKDVSGSIFIDSMRLCELLEAAEHEQEGEGVVEQLLVGARKRRRQKSPLEEVNSDDNRRFVDDERRVRRRASIEDGSYNSSQSEARF